MLLELSERLGAAAHRSLAARGVDVRTLALAISVDDASAALADGSRLATSTVICTMGSRPNMLVETLAVPTARGRIIVNADLFCQ